MSELPDYNKITFPENQPVPFEEILPDASREALDLLRRFLVYPSKKRIPAKEVGGNRNNNGRNGSCLTWLATSLEEKRRCLIINASPQGQCSK